MVGLLNPAFVGKLKDDGVLPFEWKLEGSSAVVPPVNHRRFVRGVVLELRHVNSGADSF